VPSFLLLPDVDTWQLIINTITTIVTFLLVALLQNTETRAENATQRKLNAIAVALADLMEDLGAENPDLRRSRDELTAAVGVEHRESTK
jgi:low affinity Fe/Cu permease